MSPYCSLQHLHVIAYAGTAVVPPMTTSSLRLGKWLTEYAHLMRVIRSDAGRIWSGMAELFELYFLHTFHTFGDITIAALMSTQQQRQVLLLIPKCTTALPELFRCWVRHGVQHKELERNQGSELRAISQPLQ